MKGNNSKENNPEILMQQAKNGNTVAFGRLYEIYFVPIFRYTYLRVKDKAATEDLVQTVFLKVFQSVGQYKGRGGSPLAYFFTVARNAIIDYQRRRKEIIPDNSQEFFAKLQDTALNPQELLEKGDMAKTVRAAIHQLTEEQEEVIILKFINDLSNSEIAQLLGKSEEAIRQLQCRGLKMLRQQLKDFRCYGRQYQRKIRREYNQSTRT